MSEVSEPLGKTPRKLLVVVDFFFLVAFRVALTAGFTEEGARRRPAEDAWCIVYSWYGSIFTLEEPTCILHFVLWSCPPQVQY